ncbi:hypothetical protein ACFYV7_30855 [Nocardia suismassiliense]|uniref:Uncharacterized protein n=1 Tax=Nocardia suismassiliense TaxID=2077092 RepID=A0ABW6R129_9NOCA
MIPALVPPQGPLQQLIHGEVPTDQIVRVADGDLVYGVSSVGDGGRIADKHILSALGCRPAVRLEVAITDSGALLLRPCEHGTVLVTSSGHIRIPYRRRRAVCLFCRHEVFPELRGFSGCERLAAHGLDRVSDGSYNHLSAGDLGSAEFAPGSWQGLSVDYATMTGRGVLGCRWMSRH